MASSEDQAAVSQLFAFITSKNVAIYSQTTEDYARRILHITLNRLRAHWQSRGVDKQPTFSQTKEGFLAIERDADVSQLAIDNMIPQDHIRRIFNVVKTAAEANWGQPGDGDQEVEHAHGGLQGFRPRGPHHRRVPDGSISPWAKSIPEHAYRLQQTSSCLETFRMQCSDPVVLVSEQKIQAIQDSIALLSQKITSAYGQILDDIPCHQRPEFAMEGWYTKRSSNSDAGMKWVPARLSDGSPEAAPTVSIGADADAQVSRVRRKSPSLVLNQVNI